jgi:hypothetical protein
MRTLVVVVNTDQHQTIEGFLAADDCSTDTFDWCICIPIYCNRMGIEDVASLSPISVLSVLKNGSVIVSGNGAIHFHALLGYGSVG